MRDRILIVDYGSQYTQLILKRLRRLGANAEILPYTPDVDVKNDHIKGIILAGGPRSVYEKNAPGLPVGIMECGKTVLGICYGFQLLSHEFGGKIEPGRTTEYGRSAINIKSRGVLFNGIDESSLDVWMSHSDEVLELPETFPATAHSESCIVSAECEERAIYGVQFHPEVSHTNRGGDILNNFLKKTAISLDWDLSAFMDEMEDKIRKQVGEEDVALAISGGVDSTVLAVFLKKIIGDRLHPFFIDNGLLRKGEAEQRMEMFKSLGLDVKYVDHSEEFLSQLKGVSDPDEKRMIIGRVFIEAFTKQITGRPIRFLGQGTLYPDVIESLPVYGQSSKIKLHHNVGGLPEKLDLDLVEPFRFLFKDEVRELGKLLEIPHDILFQHPFPGPGLAVRIIGDITPERLETLREMDHIFISALKDAGIYFDIWQSLAVLVPVKSTGVKGDVGISEHLCVLRAVDSVDGMTADWFPIPQDLLKKISSKITNNVKGINRVVYDITSKPPATIEWE